MLAGQHLFRLQYLNYYQRVTEELPSAICDSSHPSHQISKGHKSPVLMTSGIAAAYACF